MISIRRRLVFSIFAVLMTGTFAVSLITFFNAEEELADLLDENMGQVAISIAMQDTNYKSTGPGRKQELGEQGDFLIQVWADDGTLQYASHPQVDLPLQEGTGFGYAFFRDENWRFYVHEGSNKKIQIVQPMDEREEDTLEFTGKLLIPVAIQLPIILVLAWFMIGKGLRPLSFISDSISKRDPFHLSPISLEKVPVEIQGIVESLNKFLSRLDEALKYQRQFTADAAHELRTPLTAIKLQLDILDRADGKEERQESQTKLRSGVERCIHLAQNLLILARQEPDATEMSLVKINLSDLVYEVCGEYLPFADEQNIQLSFNKGNRAIFISGEPHSLKIMIGNIVHNAILYTPRNGKIDIYIEDNPKTILSITDNGIGIPLEERERIFDRFYRVLGTKKSGSGLGLSIVKNIAERHNAEISVHDGADGTGTEFRIIFSSSGAQNF